MHIAKINYPLAYYAAYFGIRAAAFSYELMCQGKERLEFLYAVIMRNEVRFTVEKGAGYLKDMKIVQEMYARGFEFLPIDLYKSEAHHVLQIVDGKLLPPFSSIDGMGEIAAEAVEAAAGRRTVSVEG